MRGWRQTAIGGLALFLSAVAGAGAEARQKVDVNDPLTVPRIALAEFQKLHATGGVLVVDVRDELAYQSGHIPGAVGVPLAEMDRRARDLRAKAKDRPIVTYCSCPSEHSSAEAALVLYRKGLRDVRALVGGFPEWVIAGGKIEKN